MIVWHATKTHEHFLSIKESMRIAVGRNVSHDKSLAHLSRIKFLPGNWALDVIGRDTNQAWILEIEISDSTELFDDPADDAGKFYGGGWVVCEVAVPILRIRKIEHIDNVRLWEGGEMQSSVWR